MAKLNMTDGQIELWWLVAVQPPNAFPRIRGKAREGFNLFGYYSRGNGDDGFGHGRRGFQTLRCGKIDCRTDLGLIFIYLEKGPTWGKSRGELPTCHTPRLRPASG